MNPLSVIITTFNEAHNIAAVLETVKWADEIMIVDSFSTDQTIEIAKTYTDRIVQREYSGPADQKNWAIPQAQHDWILILDADERIPVALQAEIKATLNQDIAFDAFEISRQNYFMEQKIKYSGWQGDKVIRLIRKDKCRYDDKQVHEEIERKGIRVGTLKNKMDHFTFKDLDHFLDKQRRYAEWSARDHLEKTSNPGFYHFFIKPLFRFFKHYILKGGVLDGKVGFIICVIMAWGVFLRYAKIKEINKNALS